MTTEISLGTSKTDITPLLPVRLGGFDFRREPCVKMGMPVFARCFVFNRQFAVVSLELLFAGDNLDRQIRAAQSALCLGCGRDGISHTQRHE